MPHIESKQDVERQCIRNKLRLQQEFAKTYCKKSRHYEKSCNTQQAKSQLSMSKAES